MSTREACKTLESIYEVFQELSPLKAAFPNLFSLFQIILTMAVTSASCERSFSSMKRIKTWLRTTMTDNRLADLSVLSIERDLSSELSLDEVVTDFEVTGDRRITLS